MKTIFILVYLTVIFGCRETSSIKEQSREETAIEILIDVTDPQKLKLWPDPVPILRLYDCSSNPELACTFGMQAISDISINRVYNAYLPPASETEKLNIADDIQHRSKYIVKFYDSVKALFNRFYQETDTTKSLSYSECWLSIARSLERMNSHTTTRKFLIVFSDLAENSVVTVYQKGKSLEQEAIKKLLEKLSPVPPGITGTTIIIVYQPVDRDDDTRFRKILESYRLLLEPHGVRIVHKASNESFDL